MPTATFFSALPLSHLLHAFLSSHSPIPDYGMEEKLPYICPEAFADLFLRNLSKVVLHQT
jgi:hypothetical protein